MKDLIVKLPPLKTRIIISTFLLVFAILSGVITFSAYGQLEMIEDKYESGSTNQGYGSRVYTNEEWNRLWIKMLAQEALLILLVLMAFTFAFFAIALPFFVGDWRKYIPTAIRILAVVAGLVLILALYTQEIEETTFKGWWKDLISYTGILLAFELLARAVRLVARQKPDERSMPLEVEWSSLEVYVVMIMVLMLITSTLHSYYIGSRGFGALEESSSWLFTRYDIVPSFTAGMFCFLINYFILIIAFIQLCYREKPAGLPKILYLYAALYVALEVKAGIMEYRAASIFRILIIVSSAVSLIYYLSLPVILAWLLKRARVSMKP